MKRYAPPMKRHALAALLLLSVPLAFAAPASEAPTPDAPARDAPARDARVDELLRVMRAHKTVAALVPQVQASQQQVVQQVIAGRTLTAAQQHQLDDIVYRSNARMLGALSWERMQPLYRDIYRRTFSDEDMAAMIAFYGSPAGQRLLDKMPQLMHNTTSALQQLMGPMLEQMQRDIEAGAVQHDATAPAATGAK